MFLLNHRNKWKWQLFLTLLFIAALILPVLACCPSFAPSLLSRGDETLLAAPVADFYVEVARLTPKKSSVTAIVPEHNASRAAAWNASIEKDIHRQTEDAAIADLIDALRDRSENEGETLVATYRSLRVEIRDHARNLQRWKECGQDAERPRCPDLAIPAGLPGEFDDYLNGAIAYHLGHRTEAQQAWRSLLARPEAERRYRSVWAAFMLGRCAMHEGRAEEAIRQFQYVRELSLAGFSDRTGLAAASLGWQARVELDRKRYAQAIGLYLSQAASGDPTALDSLRLTAARVFTRPDPDTLAALARDDASRQVLTAFLLARGGPVESSSWELANVERVQAWLEACAKAGARQMAGADRLAWSAYQTGDWASAERWLERADETSPIAKWIRAKLYLRAGKWQAAGPLLAEVSRLFPPEEEWTHLGAGMGGTGEPEWGAFEIRPAQRARGEWGVLQFARKNYVQALDALLVAGYWGDAAYVAERVLRPDELRAYVDRRWPREASETDELNRSPSIRHLLARRLVRLERFAEARAYFTPALGLKLDAYVAALAAGRDPKRPERERVARLWEAARIARDEGIELMGTEFAPDSAGSEGSFAFGLAAADIRPDADAPSTLFIRDRDLSERLAGSVPSPDKRFHYRYVAAGIDWEAVQLMAKEDPRRAEVLCQAGRWIKYQDPKAGDRFYRALVYRFVGKIRTGQAALALGAGALLVLAVVVVIRAIRRRQRPQYSLAWCTSMMVAAAVGLLGGLHWRYSVQALADARAEWREPQRQPVFAETESAGAETAALTEPPDTIEAASLRD